VRIDWQAIKQRLAASQEAFESAGHPSLGQLEAIWRERARLLANRSLASPTADISVLVFTVAGEACGVDLRGLIEVLPLPPVARVPGAPPPVLGAVNLRGDIRLAVDTALLLGRPPGTPRYLLLTRAPELGLAVDTVDGLHRLPAAHAVFTAPPEHIILGVADDVRVLSVTGILSHPSLQPLPMRKAE
jgi:chemotaxis signal transduction protein